MAIVFGLEGSIATPEIPWPLLPFTNSFQAPFAKLQSVEVVPSLLIA